VVSVKEKAAEPGEKLVFCIPAQPVDQENDDYTGGQRPAKRKSARCRCFA